MKSAYLEFDSTLLYFDAVTSEGAEHSATVTEHPVESGSDIADHVRDGLDTVTLEVFVSNTPTRDVNGLYGGSIESVELKVPKFERPVPLTPGGLMSAGIDTIKGALSPEEPWKAQVLKFSSKFNAVKDVLTMLDEWKKAGMVGSVITGWKLYPSVVITRVSPSRNSSTGDGATFAIEFKEIRIVESKMITAPIPTEARGAIKRPKGRQPTSFVRDPALKKSILAKLLGG